MSTTSPSNPFKRTKFNSELPPSTKVIGTHSGTFQCDEALGVWLLRQIPEYRQSKVVRTRDQEILDKLDIVIDVGGTYEHSALRYDHHQRSFDETFDEHHTATKLSASGLVYKHYGKEVIRAHYPDLNDAQLNIAYLKMYDSFMEAIDGIDTGVEIAPVCAYKDSTGLSARVGRLNPRWNEEGDDTDPDQRFEIASDLCGRDFLGVLEYVVESQIPAIQFVEEAVLARMDVDSSGEIIKFGSGGLPWKSILYDMERKHKVDPLIKFVLYTDQGGMWRIQAVSVEGQGFTNRVSLPAEWRGVRDADLSSIAGIPGCTFCHNSGFIGGNESYDGVLEMAKAALARNEES
eukprot:CAMPEP_0195521390 /NCGR_PEP_ID=MMETSP0794_2-20130614/18584_1 /TAXON_ID=515487 /ORGANISM="Stephanopyxis turris, Strain CCMP 815" /LENGTH=346 /DNA_ID=CAMNT_0040650931 /DNA_START=86 /DNA_END=1126 /DNA_ORIENTATION=+